MRYPMILLASALVVAAAATGCSGNQPTVTLQMVNFTFQPVDLSVPSGGMVRLANGTTTLHNFSLVKGGSISFDVGGGTSTTTDAMGALKPGTYPFRCKYHFKQGMIGVLTVTAASP